MVKNEDEINNQKFVNVAVKNLAVWNHKYILN